MTTGYLLDTCAWLDLRLAPERMSRKAMEAIDSQTFLSLASISLMEVTRKAASGLLVVDAPVAQWLIGATDPEAIHLLDISVPIAIDAFALPGDFHKDPADRIIVATARVHQLTIITSDKKILDYPHVRTLKSR